MFLQEPLTVIMSTNSEVSGRDWENVLMTWNICVGDRPITLQSLEMQSPLISLYNIELFEELSLIEIMLWLSAPEGMLFNRELYHETDRSQEIASN